MRGEPETLFPSPILGEGNTRGEGDLNEICVANSFLGGGVWGWIRAVLLMDNAA